MSYRARNDSENKRHDRAIRRYAKYLDRQGYRIKADTTVMENPYPQVEPIHGKRPDILATKQNRKILVEIETPSSADTKRAKEQKRRFSNWENRKSNHDFRRYTARQILKKY